MVTGKTTVGRGERVPNGHRQSSKGGKRGDQDVRNRNAGLHAWRAWQLGTTNGGPAPWEREMTTRKWLGGNSTLNRSSKKIQGTQRVQAAGGNT